MQPEGISYHFDNRELIPGEKTLLSMEAVGSGAWSCVLLTPMSDFLSSLTPLFLSAGIYLFSAFICGIALHHGRRE